MSHRFFLLATPLGLAAALLVSLALPSCSKSSASADAGPSDAGHYYDAIIPSSCGTTDDCLNLGLDADTCAFAIEAGCSALGQCVAITTPSDKSKCAPALTVCPCASPTCMAMGEAGTCTANLTTATVPECWQGYSPFSVMNVGQCAPACAPLCTTGTPCLAPSTCASGVCTNELCAAPACAAIAPLCPDGHGCGANSDCATARCVNGACATPFCAPTCPTSNVCGQDDDCASGTCTKYGKCAPPPDAGHDAGRDGGQDAGDAARD